ncbi:hypothetical protein ACIF6K_31540 [Streptomyces sp. NPDC085942]|uniref:hypothetical protein n=1 Tax=Streptomyces sp. NPDC085942 TaxID=3365743 RepID=UPI0037D1A1AB
MNPRVFDALDAEWALVCAVPGRGALVRGWLRECGALEGKWQGGLEDVLPELARRAGVQGRGFSDRWLYAVLGRAGGEGDQAQLAARLVVQAMVPAAVRLAGRLRAGRDFDETAQVVVSCLYRVVRTYPMTRRRGVSANLVLETLHWASRELARESRPEVEVSWHDGLESAPSVIAPGGGAGDPVEAAWRGLLGQQAARLGFPVGPEGVDGARGELAELLVWAVGCGLLDVARARVIAAEGREGAREAAGVSAVAWRQRRSRTVRQLRAVADQWVQAA